MREQCKKLEDAEKTALALKEKLKQDMEFQDQMNRDGQEKQALELAMANRSIQDLRTKLKIMEESKSKLESEMVTSKTEMIRMETNINRIKEKCRDGDVATRAAKEESDALRAELDRMNTDYKKLKAKAVSMEEKSLKQSNETEIAIKERDQVWFVIVIVVVYILSIRFCTKQ